MSATAARPRAGPLSCTVPTFWPARYAVNFVPSAGIVRELKSITTNFSSDRTMVIFAGARSINVGVFCKDDGGLGDAQPATKRSRLRQKAAHKKVGAPGVIRTRDPRIRNPLLCPTELQARKQLQMRLPNLQPEPVTFVFKPAKYL